MRKCTCLLLGFLLCLCGCRGSQASGLAQWAETAQLDAQQSAEELYELALSEGEDILRVYSVSTRMLEVASAFEAAYPGLLVEVVDQRAETLITAAKETIDSEVYDCDILFLTDVNGALTNDLIPNGYAHQYIPYDMADMLITTDGYAHMMPLMTEAIFISYNPTVFEEQPISNWWELTEPQWEGQVYAPNPIESVTTFAMFTMFYKYNDLLEEAYEERYGVPFPAGEGLAAEVFIQGLVENGLHLVNSSDEIADLIGLDNSSPLLGLMVSSKLRLNELGYHLAYATDVAPFDGVASSIQVMIAGGSQNINAAKLFVRFIFGETDGSGVGYLPYLQAGVWSMRTDVESQEEISLEKLHLVYSDESFSYEQRETFLEFWEALLGQS